MRKMSIDAEEFYLVSTRNVAYDCAAIFGMLDDAEKRWLLSHIGLTDSIEKAARIAKALNYLATDQSSTQ